MKNPFKLVLLLTAIVFAGAIAGSTIMADQESEAAKIAGANKNWLRMVADKDAKGIGNLYAADGVLMMPDTKIITGPEAIADAWAGMLNQPGASMKFQTSQLDIAKSGDLASDRGTYEFAFDGKDGRLMDVGKFVVVWKKVNGTWKVAADIFNSDLEADLEAQ